MDERLREERRRKEAEEQAQKAPPAIEQAPEAPKPPPPAEVRFVLTDVMLKGNTVLPSSVFAPFIDPSRDHDVTVKGLQTIADAIQAEYRRRGYVTTIAFLPPQRIEGGRVTIEILEGRVGELAIEGNRYFNAGRFRWYWPLRPGQVLRYETLRRSLARMNEHPDRQVQALLRPGKLTGQTDVILKVQDHFPFHVGSQWDSQGTKSIGRFRYGSSVRHTNLLGLDDQAAVGTVFGRRFGAVYTQYTVPVTRYGTSAAFGFSHSQVSPGRHFKDFAVNGTSQTYTLSLSQSLLDQERLSLSGQAGFDFKESRTMQLSGTSRRDRLRVLRVGPRLTMTDAWGRWFLDHEYAFGIKGLGATSENNPVASRPGADPDFFKTELRLVRAQALPWQTQAVVSLEAQLSPSKLTPQEELSLGGANSVRGYPEGDYLADQGLVIRAEYLVPCRFLPASWHGPWSKEALGEQLHMVGFVDRGYGRLRAITGEEHATRNLLGLGIGLRLRLAEDFSARVEWGFNAGDRPLTDDSRHALHFGVQHEF